MKIRNEFQIGLVGLITIIVMFFGIKFLKGSEMFSSNTTYYAFYDDVTGIHGGNYIYINGMKVGYVKSVKPANIMNSRFIVEISVNKKIKIPKDSKLTLFDAGIVSGKAMKIDLGKSTNYLSTKDTIMGTIAKGLTDGISTDFSNIMSRIDTLTASLNNTLNIQTQENIRSAIANINTLSQRLNSIAQNAENMVQQDRKKLDNILSNVENITQNLENNSQNINNIITNFNNISDTITKANVGKTLAEVNSSLENLNNVLKKIDSGKGNLGQLLNDDKLYENIINAANNLNILIADIKAHPKKYIKVSVF